MPPQPPRLVSRGLAFQWRLFTRLVTLLERVPLALVDRETLLPLAEQSRFFRAAVILLKAVSTSSFWIHPSPFLAIVYLLMWCSLLFSFSTFLGIV